MDPSLLQQLLTQRALGNQSQAPQMTAQGAAAPQGPQGAAIPSLPTTGLPSQPTSSPISNMMGGSAGQTPNIGLPTPPQSPMRMLGAPQQPNLGAAYQPQDSANDRNYL